jgi:hypothetical protein
MTEQLLPYLIGTTMLFKRYLRPTLALLLSPEHKEPRLCHGLMQCLQFFIKV